jgi:hypothetical protein
VGLAHSFAALFQLNVLVSLPFLNSKTGGLEVMIVLIILGQVFGVAWTSSAMGWILSGRVLERVLQIVFHEYIYKVLLPKTLFEPKAKEEEEATGGIKKYATTLLVRPFIWLGCTVYLLPVLLALQTVAGSTTTTTGQELWQTFLLDGAAGVIVVSTILRLVEFLQIALKRFELKNMGRVRSDEEPVIFARPTGGLFATCRYPGFYVSGVSSAAVCMAAFVSTSSFTDLILLTILLGSLCFVYDVVLNEQNGKDEVTYKGVDEYRDYCLKVPRKTPFSE